MATLKSFAIGAAAIGNAAIGAASSAVSALGIGVGAIGSAAIGAVSAVLSALGIGTGGADQKNSHNNNFQSIATDYRPGAIYGRFDKTAALSLGGDSYTNGNEASNGLTNRVIWGVGVKATPAALNKLTAGLAYWDYRFQQMMPGDPAAGGNRHIGGEYDLTAEWKHSENVSLTGALGTFQPGGYINNENRQATNYVGLPGRACSPAFLANFNVAVKF